MGYGSFGRRRVGGCVRCCEGSLIGIVLVSSLGVSGASTFCGLIGATLILLYFIAYAICSPYDLSLLRFRS
jgi:hypothetical protein